MKKFIAECHRRHVFRVAALYIVGAWVVLQVFDLAFEAWNVPSEALRIVWIGTIFGLPVALIFGWRYDIVAGRIVPTPHRDGVEDVTLVRADYLVLSSLGLVVAAMVFGLGAEITAIQEPGRAPVATASRDPMFIAVLPFKDTSLNGAGSEFLAAGIQDDLLTRLSRISSLKVISRTSVKRYEDTDLSIPEIAAELGVGKILEGGIQSSDEMIRINVQLIDTNTDEHIWAQTFDRDLNARNLFDIQSEIVATITQQLQASLTPQETQNITAMPTRNIAAYTAYLKGKSLTDAESIESLNRATAAFQEAIALDPGFALAYVGLADAYLTLGANFYGGLPTDESLIMAEPPLMHALAIDPELGQAYATLGLLRQQQGDIVTAEDAFRRAIELQPNYSRVFRLYGRLRWNQNRRDEARELFQKALDLDPYSAAVNFQYARALDESAEFDAAMERYRRVVEIEPESAFAYVYIAALHFLVYGQIDESLVWYQKAAQYDPQSPSLQSAQAIGYLELGDVDSARYWVEKAMQLGPRTFWAEWSSLLVNLYSGDDDAAQRNARTLLELFPRYWGAHKLLRNADIAAGRLEIARARYAREFGELLEPEIPEVTEENYRTAIDLALVLMRLGEHARAHDLLEGSLQVIASIPRLGGGGYWISDVQIYALQNRPDRALDALRQAIDEGWRLLTWYGLEHDPNLDSIRDDPRFHQLYNELKTDIAAQARRVTELKASGEISPIAFHRKLRCRTCSSPSTLL